MKTEITTPISDFLRDYAASGISRFHMPGHKGTDWCHEDAGCAIFSHDITEVKGADSLYEASGIIRESEENAALLFGSAATYYSTEGSSQCIRAMLALAASFGKRSSGGHPPLILAARNVHRSFLTAAASYFRNNSSARMPLSISTTCPVNRMRFISLLRIIWEI